MPKAVRRTFRATCPVHGKVRAESYGHHLTSSRKVEDEAVVYEADEGWQEVAFAVLNIDRPDDLM
jgi:hypothetical protein